MTCRLSTFGGRGEPLPDLRDLSALHAELLAHSPVVIMGPRFMETFYYDVLIRDSLVCGALAYVDGEPAGFVVATDRPRDFMKITVRRHWLRCATSMTASLLRRPGRVLALKEAFDIQKNTADQPYPDDMGEMLSFGVRKAYRSRQFLRDTGCHIGRDLIDSALQQLRTRGVRKVRAVVDQDNLEAKFFYRNSGWVVGNSQVRGWSVPTMEFVRDID